MEKKIQIVERINMDGVFIGFNVIITLPFKNLSEISENKLLVITKFQEISIDESMLSIVESKKVNRLYINNIINYVTSTLVNKNKKTINNVISTYYRVESIRDVVNSDIVLVMVNKV